MSMTKPEDIPQWAWEKAVFALYGQAPDEWIERQIVIISRCARAILSAVEEEREACAVFVERFTPIRPAFETEDEGGIKWPHPAEQLPIYQPAKLALAIRSRKEA